MSNQEAAEVIILGAGFSRALSEHLPLANRLGQLPFDDAKSRDSNLFEGSPRFSDEYPFEVWLSLLADDQPHLDEGENRLNGARFSKLKESIVRELKQAQTLALGEADASWLFRLLTVLHRRRSVVITLNYDTLIEVGVLSTYLGSATSVGGLPPGFDDVIVSSVVGSAKGVVAEDILGGEPPTLVAPRFGNSWSFRLLKLHGSLDWWSAPHDESGSTLAREPTLGRFGAPADRQPPQSLPGREPFVVPPLASKSAYYRNPVTRQLWRDAHDALARATRISIVGYSLPQTDIVMAGMLESALAVSQAELEVVNPDAEGVLRRLKALGAPSSGSTLLTSVDGPNCVSDWVDRVCERASSELPRQIAELRPIDRPEAPDPVRVAWSRAGSLTQWQVRSADLTEDGLLVLVADPEVLGVSGGSGPTPTQVVSMMGEAKRIVLDAPDGQRVPIVGFDASHFDNPNNRHILQLVAAGQM